MSNKAFTYWMKTLQTFERKDSKGREDRVVLFISLSFFFTPLI